MVRQQLVVGRVVSPPRFATSGADGGGTDSDPSQPASPGLVWLLAAALAGGALVLFTVVLPHPPPTAAPLALPWWLLAVGFLLAEAVVVHYDFRQQAHTYSLSELPLVFGLFFAAPQELVAGVVAGAGLALLLVRRQSALKVAFNVAHFAFGACVAVLVFQALDGAPGGFSPRDWLAALAACLLSSVASTAAILVAIWWTQRAADVRRLPEQLLLAAFTTTGSASLGLMAVGATWHHPAGTALLVVPAVSFLLAHRSVVLQRQERDSLELLHRTARVLDEAPDVVTAMRDLVRSACTALRAEVAQLALLAQHDPGLVLVVSTAGEAGTASGYVRLDDVDPVLQRALRSPAPELLPLSEPLTGPGGSARRQVLVAPLGASPDARGVLLVADRLGPAGTFRRADLRLLETLATQVDVSLDKGRLARALAETARRAERERENALVLQRGILPPAIPRLPGASVAVRYLPGTADVEVGGDWYDVIPLPDGDVGFAIGDIVGHDLEAAARMGQARSALRAYAADGHPPAAVVERLNRLLTRTDPDFMGTCCYLQFSPGRGTLTLVSAGHPPPLLLAPGERPRLLEVEANLPLGVAEDVQYMHTVVPLPAGTTLALYTDGLVETRTMPLETGLSRLTALPATGVGDHLEDLAERLVATAPAGTVADDLTLLLLRAEAGPDRAAPRGAAGRAGDTAVL